MNEELELITVTISLAARAMNENNCRTATGKPAFSAVMQSMSRHLILPRAFGNYPWTYWLRTQSNIFAGGDPGIFY